MKRHYSTLDRLCLKIDQALKTLSGDPVTTTRIFPAEKLPADHLSSSERKQSAALMRVNHAGEVSAQALYHAQGLASRCHAVRDSMRQAAIEEGDHLAWCSRRLVELGSHTSYLNPVWYAGSFVIGLAAGLAGDRWSLGFLAETEQQVVHHLENHLQQLPPEDKRSLAIVQQMREDEAHHRNEAIEAGGVPLPAFVKAGMRFMSNFMVKVAYWV